MLFLPALSSHHGPPTRHTPARGAGAFLWCLLWNLVMLQEVKLCPSPVGSPGVVNSALSTLTPSDLWITVQIFLPWHWFPWWFLLVSIYLVNLDFLFSNVCLILGQLICPVLSPLLHIWENCWFSVCSAFYLLLGWSMIDFQAAYMRC